ncbi:Zn-dependent exopeptidase [Tilletiaria anomala UBC 951]|uniref:Inactive metallocarboxypeptidase ECM14 n=1 Tax=Tilletiaria anomala (strain ATCC 24038 / CBS 436.72 / UBC 951) TaxID=1037660 RepID=A0A066VSA5_TILAU|nr:Zn-dependent exopeptidase [Tilletiaria anomala UBC 951]KDN41435.1 Zn-dependent exopeptidase [Tilletiaria anomala UBC 951]
MRLFTALIALTVLGAGRRQFNSDHGRSPGVLGPPLASAAPAPASVQTIFQAPKDNAERNDQSRLAAKGKGKSNEQFHEAYHTYNEIEDYITQLVSIYPQFASVISLGTTWENRSILALQISLPSDDGDNEPGSSEEPPSWWRENLQALLHRLSFYRPADSGLKPGLMVVAGTHAREWVSTASSLYFADKVLSLAQEYQTGLPPAPVPPHISESRAAMRSRKSKAKSHDQKRRRGRIHRRKPQKPKHDHASLLTPMEAYYLLDAFTLTLVPLSNPDGYAYTWDKHKGNRLWKKNRQPASSGEETECIGIDVNRNWDYAFVPSSDPAARCSESFAGSEALEALETRALSNFLLDEGNNVKAFVDLHSYGQHVMYPFATSCQEALPDEEDLAEVALGSAKALRELHKSSFTTGRICDLLFSSWSNSIDWSYAVAKIKWSFAVELRDVGTYGFLLPAQQIVPTGEELVSMLAYLLHFIEKVRSRKRSFDRSCADCEADRNYAYMHLYYMQKEN